jgi:O-antigen ligase
LVLLPFHALLTVWIGGSFGAYEASRLWKEALIAALVPLVGYWLYKDVRLRQALQRSSLMWLIVAYAALHVLLGLWALARGDVSSYAMAYALTINLRFLAFFVICLVVASKVGWLRERLPLVVLVPAGLVVLFGLLQIVVLPMDVLRHIGYGPDTIAPFQTVDQKLDYLRVQSTLRGANPLGAYMVIIIADAAALFAAKTRTRKTALATGGLLVASLLVLGFTYSRSAYLGAALALLVLSWLLGTAAVRRWLVVGVAGLVLITAGTLVAFRNNDRFQNVVFHTDESSQAATSSNETRLTNQKQAFNEVLQEPLGRGPGTAGPASQHNNHPARISENYYLQLGQEIGWLGLGLFLAIVVLVIKTLWRQWDTALDAALLASLVGILFINLVSHAWADDTLSLLWWGMAGILFAPAILKKSISDETR